MKGSDDAIELLISEPSQELAQQLVNMLRNAGLVIHPTIAGNEKELLEALPRSALDLILCDADVDADGFLGCIGHCLQQRPDIPVVILYSEQDPEVLLQALRNGARDVVSKEDPEHLALVVQREFADLRTRRALRQAEERLRETEARCTALMDHSRDAIAYIHEGMHVRANAVYLEMFGFPDMEEIEGLPILDMIAADDLDRFKRFLRSPDASQGELEIRCRSSQGTTFDARIEFSPASIDGEACTQIIIRSRGGDSELEEKLQQVSSQDSLTGLSNRHHFMQQLQESMRENGETGAGLTLLYLSIDHFHQLRSRIGLAAADLLLREFADTFLPALAEGDLPARFGDHAFAILTRGDTTQGRALAGRILQQIGEHLFQIENHMLQPVCSVGIATRDDDIGSAQELVNAAYQACESVAADGSDRIASYRPEEMTPAFGEQRDEARISTIVDQAISGEGPRVLYQPVVSLEGDSRELYAVLSRLLDDSGDELLPDEFIPVAEQGGKMGELDRLVIRHAMAEAVRQRSEGRKVCFFLPLSEASLKDDQLLLWVCDRLRELNARGAWFVFSMTEEMVRDNMEQARRLTEGLKKIKCQIAVDRYGMVENPENLLKHIPVDYVRFDPSFASNLTSKHTRQEELSEMNQTVQKLGVRSIVTGVEDANTLAVLWTVGVNYIQGYFLQEPSEQISYDFSAT
ncbi:MAG TPA: GGDEF domain-containing response regulator [Sedimenticola thiotaurini]|uniref:GGDEF domain-containing response regulator n=1 Tax=Sedimenticola thiotaurini TaxID=1543721 RepID=A0A831RJE3_9GAMM|nr:GGDEF domain-containing response regulator [Sedimenticola thiotaurini]